VLFCVVFKIGYGIILVFKMWFIKLFLVNETRRKVEDDASLMEDLGLRRDHSALSRGITLCLNTPRYQGLRLLFGLFHAFRSVNSRLV
jgi:hypothetical protein